MSLFFNKTLLVLQQKKKFIIWLALSVIFVANLPLAFYSVVKETKNVNDIVLIFPDFSQKEVKSIDFWSENRLQEKVPMHFSKRSSTTLRSPGNHIRSFSLAMDKALFDKLQRFHLSLGSFDQDITKFNLDQHFELIQTDNRISLTTKKTFQKSSLIPFCDDVITWKGDLSFLWEFFKNFFFQMVTAVVLVILPLFLLLGVKKTVLFLSPYLRKEHFVPTDKRAFQSYLVLAMMILIVIGSVQFFSAKATAWEWPTGDNFSFFEIRQNPPHLENDYFAQSSLKPNARWGYQYLIWGISSFLKTDYYSVFFFFKGIVVLFFLPLWFFVLAQILRKYQKLTVEGLVFLLFLGVFLLSIQNELSIAWWPFFSSQSIPANMAMLLLLVAFSLDLVFVRKKTMIGLVPFLVVFATVIHPVIAFFMIIAYLTLSLLSCNLKVSVKQILLFLLPWTMSLMSSQIFFCPQVSLNTADYIDIYVKQAAAAHYWVSEFGKLSYLEWWQSLILVDLLLVLPIVYFAFHFKRFFPVIIFGLAAMIEINLAVFFQYFFIDVFPLKLVAMLGPVRFTLFSLVFITVLWTVFLTSFFQGKPLFPPHNFKHGRLSIIVLCLAGVFFIPFHIDDPRMDGRKKYGALIDWVKEKTPLKSVFLIQTNSGLGWEFPLLTYRAMVAGHGFPFGEDSLREFLDRNVAVDGHWSEIRKIKGSWIGERRKKFFQNLQDTDILKIKQRFQADYLLEPSDEESRKFPIVFEDSQWRVYQIKGGINLP